MRTLDDKLVNRLEGILGAKNLVTDPEALEAYGRDETPGLFHQPAGAAKPGSAAEAAAVLKTAREAGVPVTPRGAGTGLAGGAVPIRGGLVLSLERMNRILELDPENLTAVVEAGLITNTLREAAAREGLFYPPDPASLESCTLGGNLATNAGGPAAVKYGVTRDYLRGLEAVLAGGEPIRWGGKAGKNSSGYGLGPLLIGSEGTLGVITQAILRLLPLPKRTVSLWSPFPDAASAAAAVAELRRSRLAPAALELIGARAAGLLAGIEVACPTLEGAAFYLLSELDGDDPPYEKAGEILLKTGALDVLVAESRPEREKLWNARRKITEAVKAAEPAPGREDIAVPPGALPRTLADLEKLAAAAGAEAALFGHAGDGNLHVNLLRGKILPEKWAERRAQLEAGVLRLAVENGGVISGEHGIGLLKRPYLALNYNPAALAAMGAIKRALDPEGLLNPGKVLP